MLQPTSSMEYSLLNYTVEDTEPNALCYMARMNLFNSIVFPGFSARASRTSSSKVVVVVVLVLLLVVVVTFCKNLQKSLVNR